MSRPSPNSATFCGSRAARPSVCSGMPMSPPETTSVASWPTTWPSCIANSAPPMPRIMRLAPWIIDFSSSGACSLMTRVRESEMLSATGSASCDHTGIVAATHARRVSSSGVSGSAEKSTASSSQSEATCRAWSRRVRSSGVSCRWPDAARSSPWRSATLQSMPSPPRFIACCSWPKSAARLAGSLGSPAAPASCDGSIPPDPERSSRSMSRNSSSGFLSPGSSSRSAT